jgi:hypothetical protein
LQLSIAKQEAEALDEANSSTGKFAIRKTSLKPTKIV